MAERSPIATLLKQSHKTSKEIFLEKWALFADRLILVQYFHHNVIFIHTTNACSNPGSAALGSNPATLQAAANPVNFYVGCRLEWDIAVCWLLEGWQRFNKIHKKPIILRKKLKYVLSTLSREENESTLSNFTTSYS